jgi:hypothetical protein
MTSYLSSFITGLKGLLTTKGDILSYSTTEARLGVGANDTVLTADSTQTLGLKWAAAGGKLEFIGQNLITSSASSSTFTITKDIFNDYGYLMIVGMLSANGASNVNCQVNGDTNGYFFSSLTQESTTLVGADASSQIGFQIINSDILDSANAFNFIGYITMQNESASGNMDWECFCYGKANGTQRTGGHVGQDNDITQVKITSSNTFTGRLVLYGAKL